MRRWAWLWLMAGSVAAHGQKLDVTLTAAANPADCRVGDRVIFAVRATAPTGAVASFEATPPDFHGFELVTAGEPIDTNDGPTTRTEWSWELRPTATGELLIGPFTVTWNDARDGQARTLSTERVSVRVRPGVPNDDLRPAKPPLELPDPWEAWRLAGEGVGGAALVTLLLALILRRAGRRPAPQVEPPPPPPPTPAALALAALAALEAERLPEQGLIDVYHVRLSQVVRDYLGARYGFHAPESTTSEIAARLDDAGVAAELVSLTRQVLYGCDLEKFAAYQPGLPEMAEVLARARTLIARTLNERSTGGTP